MVYVVSTFENTNCIVLFVGKKQFYVKFVPTMDYF